MPKTVDNLYVYAKAMPKRSLGAFESCKTILRTMELDWQSYEQAVRKIANILRV